MRIFRHAIITGTMLVACLLIPTAAFASPRPAHSSAQSAAASTVIHPVDVVLHLKPGIPESATGCTHNIYGTELVCIYVNGSGLIVNYATVTNEHAPTGRALISDTYDGVTYGGPYNFGPGHAWRHDFNLHMKNGDRVCGSVSGLDVACVTIHS